MKGSYSSFQNSLIFWVYGVGCVLTRAKFPTPGDSANMCTHTHMHSHLSNPTIFLKRNFLKY